jgi:hypothetical protein
MLVVGNVPRHVVPSTRSRMSKPATVMSNPLDKKVDDARQASERLAEIAAILALPGYVY